jgi:hypothetical protein
MIIFTDHARRRMAERKISKQQVITTLKQPDAKKDGIDRTKLLQKKYRDKTLEVVVEFYKNKIVIITLYWI